MKLEDSILGLRNIKNLHLHICVATDMVSERGRRSGCPMYHGSIPQRAKIPLFAKKPRPVTAIFVPGEKWPKRKLTTHPYTGQRLEVNGAIPLLSYISSWHALGQI
jgi:hypothetical protein